MKHVFLPSKYFLCLSIFVIFMSGFLFSNEENHSILYSGSGTYWMVERSNYRRYDNGSYTGLTSREVHSFIHPTIAPKNCATAFKSNRWFEGSFLVDEKTMRNYKSAAIGLDGSIPSSFHISNDGILTPVIDNGFPTFRSFPTYPSKKVSIGDSWTGSAIRSVDPLNKGVYTKIPMEVQYTFMGEETYKGRDVFKIRAQWATRYGLRWIDYGGDNDLVKASGVHKADIMVLKDTGSAFVINDTVDETFLYRDGTSVQFKGHLTFFTEFPPALQHDVLVPQFKKIAKKSENLIVEETPAGIRLSVRNAHFKPNSDEFENGESSRLDAIAQVLNKCPSSKFLIEGHTAAIGTEDGEYELSLARAKRTAKELSERGIAFDRFIFKGLGRSNPIADNETQEGRALNRRVEVTILE